MNPPDRRAEETWVTVSDFTTSVATSQWDSPRKRPTGAAHRSPREVIARLEDLARLDATTQLPRRRSVIERIGTQLPGPGSALALFEVRGMRSLNNALGHSVVDRLLATLAHRLAEHPHVSWAGVLGAGRYVVELGTKLDEEALVMAASVLERLRRPVDLDRWVRTPDVVGAVVCTTPGHLDVDQVLRDFETGTAGATPDSRLVLVDEARRSAGLRRVRVESDLPSAISSGDVFFRYQPIVRVGDARPMAVESLARWRHHILGPIRPDEFVAVAEASELIHALGDHALEDAVATIAGWRSAGVMIDLIHVNVSAVQLTDAALVTRVADLLDRHDVEPQRLEIEVTESAVLDTSGVWRSTLAALRDIGVRVAIDDFGAGFSSLLSLRDVAADTVKLDRSMIDGIVSDDGARSLVETTIALAHQFGMDVVAEGVETEDDHQTLAGMGCDLGQGWLWHRDLDADDVANLWQASARPTTAPGNERV